MTDRDVEKEVTPSYFAATLRRIADAIEAGTTVRIQVAGERITVPAGATLQVAHEVEDGEHELEFELLWTTEGGDAKEDNDAEDDDKDEEDND